MSTECGRNPATVCDLRSYLRLLKCCTICSKLSPMQFSRPSVKTCCQVLAFNGFLECTPFVYKNLLAPIQTTHSGTLKGRPAYLICFLLLAFCLPKSLVGKRALLSEATILFTFTGHSLGLSAIPTVQRIQAHCTVFEQSATVVDRLSFTDLI